MRCASCYSDERSIRWNSALHCSLSSVRPMTSGCTPFIHKRTEALVAWGDCPRRPHLIAGLGQPQASSGSRGTPGPTSRKFLSGAGVAAVAMQFDFGSSLRRARALVTAPRRLSRRVDGWYCSRVDDDQRCWVAQAQGVSSASRLLGQLLTSLVSTSVR